jgi:dephospho-CoA kinase
MAAVVVVGLTGGIATGKSTAAAALARRGAPVLRADDLAREVVRPGTPVLEAIREAFGPEVLLPDGSLDRAAMARRVFSDPEARRRLEALTHPAIRARAEAWIGEARRRGAPAVVYEVPLLFEVGLHRPGGGIDRIWVVAARPEVQLERLMRRDGLAEAEARARLAAQWPLEAKVRGAHRVFWNDGPPEDLERAVVQAWQELLEEVRAARGG